MKVVHSLILSRMSWAAIGQRSNTWAHISVSLGECFPIKAAYSNAALGSVCNCSMVGGTFFSLFDLTQEKRAISNGKTSRK